MSMPAVVHHVQQQHAQVAPPVPAVAHPIAANNAPPPAQAGNVLARPINPAPAPRALNPHAAPFVPAAPQIAPPAVQNAAPVAQNPAPAPRALNPHAAPFVPPVQNAVAPPSPRSQGIAGGHAWASHRHEFAAQNIPFANQAEFAQHVSATIHNPASQQRNLGNGRTAYQNGPTVVIDHPHGPDGGTAFPGVPGRIWTLH